MRRKENIPPPTSNIIKKEEVHTAKDTISTGVKPIKPVH